MNQLAPISSPAIPAFVAAAGERASMRFLEFFAANIRNPHTRRAYYRAAEEFLGWCASVGVPSIAAVQPVHVAAWIEASTRELAAPSVKQRRHIGRQRREFDEIVVNPEADPPITNDAKHHDFFDAIVNKRGTVPDMPARELAAYRSYLRNGDAPPLSKPEPVMQPPGATQ